MDCWLNIGEACGLLNVSEATFRRHLLGRLPDGAIDATRRANRYDAAALVAAYGEWRVESALAAERRSQRRVPTELRGEPDSAAVWGGGGDSPALERLRTAKARHAELDLAAREGELLTRTHVVDALNLAFGGVRNLLWRWERRHRDSEAQELRDAVQRGLAALAKMGVEPDGGADDADSEVDGETGSDSDSGDCAAGGGTASATGGDGEPTAGT